MTAQQPEHCKSEGRCIDFTFAPKEWLGENGQCLLCGCDGDTRTRPHTPTRLATIDEIKQKVQEVKDVAEFVQVGQAERDAAIARAATLKTLDKVIRIMEAKYPMMQNLKSDIESLRKQEDP
jgi:hypothetical protein